MYQIRIPIERSTFISSSFPNSNFSNNKNMLLGKIDELGENRILMDIPLDRELIKNKENIVSAKLIIKYNYIRYSNIKNYIRIFKNLEEFDKKTVTWCTAPPSVSTNIVGITRADCNETYISFDIKDIVSDFVERTNETNGIGLRAINSGFKMVVFKDSFIIIELKDISKREKVLKGVQLQAKRLYGAQIRDNESIIFDEILNNKSNDIEYNFLNGEIKICNSGNYYISWWISIYGSEGIEEAKFSIQDNEKLIDIKGNIQLPLVGNIVGDGFISVYNKPIIISLKNISGGIVELQYGEKSVQANLVILQLS